MWKAPLFCVMRCSYKYQDFVRDKVKSRSVNIQTQALMTALTLIISQLLLQNVSYVIMQCH